MDIHVIINDPVVCWGTRQREIVMPPPLSLSGNSLVTHSISSQNCYLVLQKSQSVPISPFSLQASFRQTYVHVFYFLVAIRTGPVHRLVFAIHTRF